MKHKMHNNVKCNRNYHRTKHTSYKFKTIPKLLVLLAVIILYACGAPKALPEGAPKENLIIFYSPDAGKEGLLEAARYYESDVIYIYQNFNGIAVTVPKGKTLEEAIKYYGKVKGVISVQRDEKVQID